MSDSRGNAGVRVGRRPDRAWVVAAVAVALTAGCAGSPQEVAATRSGTSASPAAAATPPQATRLEGQGTPNPGTRYLAADGPVPFTFTVPLKDGVPGSWMYGAGPQLNLGLRSSPPTGNASTVYASLDAVFDPQLEQPFAGQTQTVAAPKDAAGWEQWLLQTGVARVVGREVVELNGVRVVRLRVEVAQDLPSASRFPCMADESCLALSPRGPAIVGAVGSRRYLSEIAVFERPGVPLLAVSGGAAETVDQWLPLMHAVQESVELPTP